MKKFFICTITLWCMTVGVTRAQTKRPQSGRRKDLTNPLKQSMKAGERVYNQYCTVCHQPDGEGVPHLNPPLTQTSYVLGDKQRLIQVVLKGLSAHEPIDGVSYSNVMPAHTFLTDRQIADVLTFIRNSFGNKASPIQPNDITAQRTIP